LHAAAIGAKMGMPDREVVALWWWWIPNDIQELGTIFRQSPVKIVVLNNEFLGMVRQWQQLFLIKWYTEMTNPNFVAIAEGYINQKKSNQKRRFRCCCRWNDGSKDSYFLRSYGRKENNVFPMIPTGASVSEIRLS
jgi:acetolactate synthase-1/2/3 large subunit